MPDFPLPSNVKEVISGLPVKDQVVLRSYIAGLRDTLKEYKEKAERREINGEDDDPHAHYHGHDKCTEDHGHDSHDHHDDGDAHHHGHEKCTEDHGHKNHDHHGDAMKDGDGDAHHHGHEKCTEDHGHNNHDHHGDAMKDGDHDHAKDSGHSHEHDHKKHEHKKNHEEKHGHDHSHNHDEKMAEADAAAADVPAWKKRAMESGEDATAAPFGGSWGAESSVDATK